MSRPARRGRTLIGGLLALAIGAGSSYWYAIQERRQAAPVPAKDKMGMDHLPVHEEEQERPPRGTVIIDPVTVQNIGVRTAVAERRSLSRTVRAVGRVDYNEERLVQLHPKTEGWVERLFVDKTGMTVPKDGKLLSLYSPELVTTQQEYLLALRNLEALKASPYADIRHGAKELVRSTRSRLQFLDVPEHQIRELEQTGQVHKDLHLHSPIDGVVLQIGVREGQYVAAPTELYRLADLSRVWVYVDVYEYELPWVKVGDAAKVRVAALPGQIFEGQVAYIYPYLEQQTRTVQLRLEFENPDLLLKPEMFTTVTIQADKQAEAVVVPEASILRTGTRDKLFVVRAPGKFEPREVQVGVAADGWVEILAGVEAGETVVTSSQFLIDSESKLREAVDKMREPHMH